MFQSPFLKQVRIIRENMVFDQYPFNLPLFREGDLDVCFNQPITILVGENGTGKSTLLEAMAAQCGFNVSGGNRNHVYASDLSAPLEKALRLSWLPKVTNGFFLRAESFFNFATHIDDLADPSILASYGGKSLHEQSHGESFLSLFSSRLNGRGIFLLDEPEAALSPLRQLSFLRILHEAEMSGEVQVIMATHSPILMAYPGAQVLEIQDGYFREVDYRETGHFSLSKQFLDSPERFFGHLFSDED